MTRNTFDQAIKEAKTIVIKIGSARVSGNLQEINDFLFSLAGDIRNLFDEGKKIILVSSGAIAQGRNAILQSSNHLKFKNESLPEKQALASLGQNRLMNLYESFFSKVNITIAQILFGLVDIKKIEGLRNLRNTFEQLLLWNALPIVNENDSIATEELKLGDNDFLSAIVSAIIGADLLIILTGVDGFIKNGKTIDFIEKISDDDLKFAKGPEGPGSGGMNTKLRSARFLANHGIPTAIINGKIKHSVSKLLHDNQVGTLIPSISAKKELSDEHFIDLLTSNFSGDSNGRS